jgi:hypothetical protein
MTTKHQPPQASPGLTELLGRALTDDEFRERLFSDQAAATREFQLTETDRAALEDLDRAMLDREAGKLAAGSASALAISIVIKIKF